MQENFPEEVCETRPISDCLDQLIDRAGAHAILAIPGKNRDEAVAAAESQLKKRCEERPLFGGSDAPERKER